MEPEARARQVIDRKLQEAGWIIQDYEVFNPIAGLGVAVNEYQTNGGCEADYALFVDGEPVGLIEAKRSEEGLNLPNEAHEQNLTYKRQGLKGHWENANIRFLFEATDIIINFTDYDDPKPRMREIFSFFRPETLKALINERKRGAGTLRSRLMQFPELPKSNFRNCQYSAITNLEHSFAQNNPRALVQMATGAGKTVAAITTTYRLLKHAKACRVLFLVDTRNLGEQAEMAFKAYQPYDTNSKLCEIYNLQRIQSSYIPADTQICISTIQRLYSMLQGNIETFSNDIDDDCETTGSQREVVYNATYPPEFFDFIIIDECHRSIYNQWRQVLEYFDAFLIGLTATPSKHTYSFFNQNVVSEYTHEEAVCDGVNVGAFGTFVIETKTSKQGGTVERYEQKVEIRDKRTREKKWQETDEDIEYDGKDLDRSVVNKSQIRLILQTFKDNWRKWIYFRDRDELPKTLIFAKDESHATDIVEIAREVFAEGNDFCKKITYRSEEDEQQLLNSYRHEYFPRIAVTVQKIATGTDVKPIEILVFMRDIRSESYYDQMLGRARRILDYDELREASPSAHSQKLGYVIVDAVGVTKSPKMQSKGSNDYKHNTSFKQLIENVVTNDNSSETFASLGTRIDRLKKVLTPNELEQFAALSGGVSMHQLADNLLMAHNPDQIEADIKTNYPEYFDANTSPIEKIQIEKDVVAVRCRKAALIIYNPEVRHFLLNVRSCNEQTIDPALDSLLNADFSDDVDTNKDNIRQRLREYIDTHRDEITALQIIYNQDFRHRHLTEAMVKELCEKLKKHNASLDKNLIFTAYEEKTKKQTVLKELMDIVQIVRYEWQHISELTPFADGVRRKYQEWMFEKNKNKSGERGTSNEPFTAEQTQWLQMIRDYIAQNGSVDTDAFDYGQFNSKGGIYKFAELFGNANILEEMNNALVA